MSDWAGGGWLVFCSSPSPPLQSVLPLLSPPRVSLIPTEFDPQSAGKLFSLYIYKLKGNKKLKVAFDVPSLDLDLILLCVSSDDNF